MTTRRKQSQSTSRTGVNVVRDVVERANCIFQEIEQSNDIGNDAYIEFIRSEEATGCCICAQIKSGSSYVAGDGSLVLTADRDHFEYWASHVLPVAGFVVDPASDRVGWCDITAHLRENPDAIVNGPYRIPVRQLLTADTFGGFQSHFVAYREQYSDDTHFGTALDRFTPFHAPAVRMAALRSLFSFHRNRPATWCYVASLLRSIEDPSLLQTTALALSHLPGHGDIYWHAKNEIDPAARQGGTAFLKLILGRDEIIQLLRVVDENGFTRGTIGQAVHALIDLAPDPATVLRSIALDSSVDDDVRYAAIFLFVYYAQETSTELCIETLAEYRRAVPDGLQDEVLVEMIQVLREHGHAAFF